MLTARLPRNCFKAFKRNNLLDADGDVAASLVLETTLSGDPTTVTSMSSGSLSRESSWRSAVANVSMTEPLSGAILVGDDDGVVCDSGENDKDIFQLTESGMSELFLANIELYDIERNVCP